MRAALTALLIAAASPAAAANLVSHCIALADGPRDLRHASLLGPELAAEEVRILYTGHATFLIENADGQTFATDFTGYVGAGIVPTVVTMNRAHSSHYTDFPDPAIPHVLRGWGTDGPGSVARHRLELEGELTGGTLVRNITTDIRGFGGGRLEDQNSIFVFEMAGLCIGHLGHLHHEPTEEQYAQIGRLDIVMAPVDGGLTLDLPTMIRVLKRLRARIVLPMHWFGEATLDVFLAGMADEFRIERTLENTVVTSLRDLPRGEPVVQVLSPRYARLQDTR
ncbi:MAG: MBL fold metallo-hydrolase [Pseudomonadota bacterium]